MKSEKERDRAKEARNEASRMRESASGGWKSDRVGAQRMGGRGWENAQLVDQYTPPFFPLRVCRAPFCNVPPLRNIYREMWRSFSLSPLNIHVSSSFSLPFRISRRFLPRSPYPVPQPFLSHYVSIWRVRGPSTLAVSRNPSFEIPRDWFFQSRETDSRITLALHRHADRHRWFFTSSRVEVLSASGMCCLIVQSERKYCISSLQACCYIPWFWELIGTELLSIGVIKYD